MKKINTNEKVATNEELQEVLKEYNNQVNEDDVHFTHIDGYYGDYSDSCCC